MAFGRRKHDSTKNRDPFEHLADDAAPPSPANPGSWGPTRPELDVEAGISSNLRDEDLE